MWIRLSEVFTRLALARAASRARRVAALWLSGRLAVLAFALLSFATLMTTGTANADVLVSNIDKSQFTTTNVGNVSGEQREAAQQFRTGMNNGGYTLESVTIFVGLSNGANAMPVITISEKSGSNPGAVLYTLTNPMPITAGANNTFTAPTGATLAGNTQYFVHIKNSNTTNASGGRFSVSLTQDDGEDSDGLADWGISNTGRSYANTPLSWGAMSSGQSIRMRLNGTGSTNPATGKPTITGPPQVGMTLSAGTADIMDANGLTGVSYAYQWLRAGAVISGATSSSYTLTSSDRNQKISVKVTFTDDGGTSEELTSDETYEVAPAATSRCGTDPVWCATLTVGHDDADLDNVRETGFEARSGRTTYGSVSPLTFTHRGVNYTVTSLKGGSGSNHALFFATTPNLPADGAGLTIHVQTYGGELDLPLADVEFDTTLEHWFFDGALFSFAGDGDTLSDVPLIRAQYYRSTIIKEPPAVGTRVAVRLSATAPGALTATLESRDYFVKSDLFYRFDLKLTEAVPAMTYHMKRNVFTVTNGTVNKAKRIHKQRRTEDGRRRTYSNHWRMEVLPDDEAEPVTVTLRGDRPCSEPGALCNGTDRLTNSPTLTLNAATLTLDDGNLPSVSIEDATANENDPFLMFNVRLARAAHTTFAVDFKTISGGTATENTDYREQAHRVLFKPGETVMPASVALIEDTLSDVGETVKAEISNARVITQSGGEFGPLTITRSQATGTIAAPATTTTNVSNLNIRIDNTSASEDDGWLTFRVRLSRAYTEAVCYDFETLTTGTADEPEDYGMRPKATFWFSPGFTEKTQNVVIMDDSLADGGETVNVKISNARLCTDASRTVTIARAQATGTIYNSDPMPKAWLSRFGRTVAEHSLDAIGERLRNEPGRRVTLGGQNLAFGEDSSLAGSRPGAEPASLLGGNGDIAPADALLRSFGDSRKDGENPPAAGHQTSVGALLLASSFQLASAENSGTGSRWSFWGRGTRTGFKGAREALTLDGDVTTATLGLDVEGERWLLGVALSRSKGEGSYQSGGTCQGVCAGEIESTLTGVYPYARYRVSEALSLWGTLGHGRGELTLTQEGGRPVDADVEMSMAAGGVRGVLFPATRTGDFELAVRSDLLVVSTSSEAVTNLNETEAETSRLRLLLEGSRAFRLGADGVLTPSVEVGLRYDGGDAETGSGLEAGGALRYTNARGLTIEVRARGLVTHEERDYEEWGVSGSVRLAPGERGRGFSMRLGSGWGAASGGAERLWAQRAAAGGVFDPDARLDAEVGYGLDALRGLLTPYSGLSISEGGRTYRAGGRFKLGERLTMSLEGDLRETDQGDEPVHGVALRGSLRW